jgi:hypothetical protein
LAISNGLFFPVSLIPAIMYRGFALVDLKTFLY